MAEGYASASGKPGVVLVTSGPGSSNLVTPMLDALMDGRPMVVICGQVSTAVQGTNAFQEIDIMALAKTCTKWAASVDKIDDLPQVIHEAFHRAMDKRPGPVLVAVPVDIGKEVVDGDTFDFSCPLLTEETLVENGARDEAQTCLDERPSLHDQLEKLVHLITISERPVICAGHGAVTSRDGPTLLAELSERCKIPVTTTLLGLGCFDETHDLALHMLGTYGSPYANYAVQSADLILVLGARLDDRVVGNPAGFAPLAREAGRCGRGGIIHFDMNPETVGKVIEPTDVIFGDLSETLPQLLPLLGEQPPRGDWLSQIQQWKKQHPFRVPVSPPQGRATPQQVMAELDRQTFRIKHCTTVTTGVGQHQMWAAQRFRFTSPRSMITSGSLGTMGFGLPAAIGAQISQPGHTVIDIDGDASFCMTMEELLTASQYNLPIKVIVFNDSTQGMIAQLQRANYGGRVCYNSQTNPDFVLLARSMKCEGQRCESLGGLAGSIQWLLQCQGPALLEILLDEVEMLPIVQGGKTIDQMDLEDPSRDDWHVVKST